MSHLQSHVDLPGPLAAFYDEVNETAEGQGVHPGNDGVSVDDVSDQASLNALVATGAATIEDTDRGRVVKLIGSPVDEDEHGEEAGHDKRTAAVAKGSQFANQGADTPTEPAERW